MYSIYKKNPEKVAAKEFTVTWIKKANTNLKPKKDTPITFVLAKQF